MTSEPPSDMDELLKQAMQMKDQLTSAQAEAAAKTVEGHSGGGVVKVTVSGAMEFMSVKIDSSAVDPQDVEMLEDLLLAALHDAVSKVNELNRSAIGTMGLDMGPGGLSGLLG